MNLFLPRPLTPCMADWCERGGRVRVHPCPAILQYWYSAVHVAAEINPAATKRFFIQRAT